MMGNGWGMGWMWLVGPIGLLVVTLVVILLTRGSNGGRRRRDETEPRAEVGSGRTRAQEILDERYARGELTDDEYQERLRVLGDDPHR